MSKLSQLLRALTDILRGAFDEPAYGRFLARHGLAPGSRSYAAFVSEAYAPGRRQRCC